MAYKIMMLTAIGMSIILFVILSFFFGQNYMNNIFVQSGNSTLPKEIDSNSLVPTSNHTESIQSSSPLVLLQKIPLTNVNGRIDHMDIDIKKHRLFVAELENNSVDVLDL